MKRRHHESTTTAAKNNFNLHVLAETASKKRARLTAAILDNDIDDDVGYQHYKVRIPDTFEHPMVNIDCKTKRIWIYFNSVCHEEAKVCVYQIPLDVFEILEKSNPVVSMVTTGLTNKTLCWKQAVVLRRFGILNKQKIKSGCPEEEYFSDARILLLSLYDTHRQASDLLNSLAKLKIMDDLGLGWKYKIITSERYFEHVQNNIESHLKNNQQQQQHLLNQRLSWSGWEYRILQFTLKNQKDAGLRAMTWCQFTKMTKPGLDKVFSLVEYLAEIKQSMDRNIHNKQIIMTRMVYGNYPKPKNSKGCLLGLLWLKNKSCRTLVERVAKELRVLELTGSRRFSSANRYHRIVIK